MSRGRVGLAAAVVGVVVLSFFLVPGHASATSGTLTITSNTTLAENHTGNIVIAANNITLDCAGFSVIGPGASVVDSKGILLDGRTGVTVTNCNVTGFESGFLLSSDASNNTFQFDSANGNRIGFFLGFPILAGATGNTFSDNTANNNLRSGFELVSKSGGNNLTNNSANGNGTFGFEVSADGNTLANNTANNEPFGFAVFLSSGVTVSSNKADHDTPGAAFFVVSSTSSIVANNTATNGNVGIQLNSSSGITIANNTANGNNFGVALTQTGTTGNLITNNIADKNTQYGFFMTSDVAGNTFQQNAACHNGIFDAFQAIPGSNTFLGNSFCTTSGIP